MLVIILHITQELCVSLHQQEIDSNSFLQLIEYGTENEGTGNQ